MDKNGDLEDSVDWLKTMDRSKRVRLVKLWKENKMLKQAKLSPRKKTVSM